MTGLWEHYQKSKKQSLRAQKVPDGSEWDGVARCHPLFVHREPSRPSLPPYQPLFQAAQAYSSTTAFSLSLCVPQSPLVASPLPPFPHHLPDIKARPLQALFTLGHPGLLPHGDTGHSLIVCTA